MIYVILYLLVGVVTALCLALLAAEIKIEDIPALTFGMIAWPLALLVISVDAYNSHKNVVIWRRK